MIKVTKKDNGRAKIKSNLYISSVKFEDGGLYTCEAHLADAAGGDEVRGVAESDVEVTGKETDSALVSWGSQKVNLHMSCYLPF